MRLASLVLPLVLSLAAASCAAARSPRMAESDTLDRYASALEQSVLRYEHEAQVSARTVPTGRFEAIFAAALARRGLSLEGFVALARTEPRFYFTQQALYAVRLQTADARVRERRPVVLAGPR